MLTIFFCSIDKCLNETSGCLNFHDEQQLVIERGFSLPIELTSTTVNNYIYICVSVLYMCRDVFIRRERY